MSAATPSTDPLAAAAAPAVAASAAATAAAAPAGAPAGAMSFGTEDFSFGTDEAAPTDASHAAPRQACVRFTLVLGLGLGLGLGLRGRASRRGRSGKREWAGVRARVNPPLPRQEWQEDEEGRAVLLLPHSRGVARVVVEHAPG